MNAKKLPCQLLLSDQHSYQAFRHAMPINQFRQIKRSEYRFFKMSAIESEGLQRSVTTLVSGSGSLSVYQISMKYLNPRLR